MLKFIESASKDEESDAIDAEKTAQGKFEGEMTAPRCISSSLRRHFAPRSFEMALEYNARSRFMFLEGWPCRCMSEL